MDHFPEYLSVGISSRRLPQPLIKALRRWLNRLAGFSQFNATYAPVIANGIPDNLAEHFLGHIGACVEINDGGLARVSPTGPVIIVANHPFGVIEGFILNAVVCSVRRDYKCLAAYKLARLPGLSQFQFIVDPIKKRGKRRINLSAWHGVFKWLRQGRVFAVFPPGRASRFSLRERRVTDVAWSPHIGAPVLPVYFPGANGLFFQLVGLIYGDLQNFLIVPEFNKMAGGKFQVVIGEMIEPGELAALNSDQQLIDELRRRTYALAEGMESVRYVPFGGAGKSTIS